MAGCYFSIVDFLFLCYICGAWLQCHTDAQQGSCRTIKFLPPKHGYYLKGHVLLNLTIENKFRLCEHHCLMESDCVSVNIGPPIDNKMICELSNSDHFQHPEDVVTRPDWTYGATENLCAIVKPCINNAKCLYGYTNKKYLCVCASGFTGENCEKDVDECASGLHSCHSSQATCTNTVGSYNCSCDQPYTGDGRTCNLVAECQNYASLNSADRNINYTIRHSYCDRGMTHGWYRFEGAAGKQMASSCPPMYRCGTEATGWLTGGHPNVADGQVSREVYFHYTERVWGCSGIISTTIQVRNCSSFYVYYLSGTAYCPDRFCGSD